MTVSLTPADPPAAVDSASAASRSRARRVALVLMGLSGFAGLGYQMAADRKGKDGTDLISLMLRATYQGEPLDEVGFAGLFVQIAVAANETTRSLLAGGLLALVANPDAYGALDADRSRMM